MTNPPAAEAPSLFFADARACRAWLGGLAMTNAAGSELLDALRVFNRAAFDRLERLKCLELLRERVNFMAADLRERQLSRPLPHGEAEQASWEGVRNALEEMETGYRRCLGDAALQEHAALIAQRVVRFIGAQMHLHSLAYRRFDGALWGRLHQQYEAAEAAGVAETKVKDSLEGEGGVSSVAEAYAQAALLQVAGLQRMGAPQIAFTEALLKIWARKLRVLAHAPPEAGAAILPMVVDLAGTEAPGPALSEALSPTERVIDVEGLSKSLRRRIRALQGGEDVAALGLPPEAAGVDVPNALPALLRHWCEPRPRPAAGRVPKEKSAGLVFGVADIHFFLSGGKPFEPPDQERELSHQEKNDIAVFGRVTERTQSLKVKTQVSQAAHSFTADGWDVVGESDDGLRLRRRASATRTVAVGKLVAVRLGDTGPFQIGAIRSLHDEGERLEMTVELFPGAAKATAARGAKTWGPAIALGTDGAFVLPTGSAFRGRSLFVWKGQAAELKVQEIVERGADFERVTAG